MPSTTPARKFALLVGVDKYHGDDSRKGHNGEAVSLTDLSGCVNDVRVIETFLRGRLGFDELRILISTPSSAPNTTAAESGLPTFENIKRHFHRIKEGTSPGDLFYFHFSGHGARLRKTDASPKDGRTEDPSLMTADYCCGKPALRGWQLNGWLKEFHDRSVRVVISLDSCYAGGAWRSDDDGHFRTPGHWIAPPNLPADEIPWQEAIGESSGRDAELDVPWGIRPENLTLMAACRSDQRAPEKTVEGKTYGAFTYEIFQYLEKTWPRLPTYRTLCDQVARQVTSQTPLVYGQDQLTFLGDSEPFSRAPLIVAVEGEKAILPVGMVHGIKTGTQFTIHRASPAITLPVSRIGQFKCELQLSADSSQAVRNHNEVVLSRLGLGNETLTVYMEPSLCSTLPPNLLYAHLQELVHGQIEVSQHTGCAPTPGAFGLHLQGEHVGISGLTSLVGYRGPIRGTEVRAEGAQKLASKLALLVAHLTRFGQILDLRNGASKNNPPFKVGLEPPSQGSDGQPFTDGQEFQYTFLNGSKGQLHLAILVLGPGFHIKQIYPSHNGSETVRPGDSRTFKFRAKVPDVLRRNGTADEKQSHRDIIRTIVTTGQELSFKSLEMPDIWDPRVLYEGGKQALRDAKWRSSASSFDWWIKDFEIYVSGR